MQTVSDGKRADALTHYRYNLFRDISFDSPVNGITSSQWQIAIVVLKCDFTVSGFTYGQFHGKGITLRLRCFTVKCIPNKSHCFQSLTNHTTLCTRTTLNSADAKFGNRMMASTAQTVIL